MSDEPAPAAAQSKIAAPTPEAKQFVNYVLGFGVGVAIGLSVYLGKAHIPLFSPLLDLIPDSLQDTLIPLSSALMGTIAAAVQFNNTQRRSSATRIRQLFGRFLTATIAGIVILMTVHELVVVRVDTTPGHHQSFLVGFTRPDRPPCPADVSDQECITHLTFNLDKIASFWGQGRLRIAKLALESSYLGATGMFGALIGLIVLTVRKKR